MAMSIIIRFLTDGKIFYSGWKILRFTYIHFFAYIYSLGSYLVAQKSSSIFISEINSLLSGLVKLTLTASKVYKILFSSFMSSLVLASFVSGSFLGSTGFSPGGDFFSDFGLADSVAISSVSSILLFTSGPCRLKSSGVFRWSSPSSSSSLSLSVSDSENSSSPDSVEV